MPIGRSLHTLPSPLDHFFFAGAAAALAGAAPLAPAAGAAAPLPAAPAAGAAAPAAGAVPAATAAASAAAGSFFATAALRCATFGSPKTLLASVHFSSSFNFSNRSSRVSTLRCRIRELALFRLRSRDISGLSGKIRLSPQQGGRIISSGGRLYNTPSRRQCGALAAVFDQIADDIPAGDDAQELVAFNHRDVAVATDIHHV